MKRTLLALPFILLLGACNEAQGPKDISQRYWQALVDNDLETARALVSSASQESFDAHVEAVNTPEAVRQVALDDEHVYVITTINPDADRPHRDRPFRTVLVLEDGAWKIDLGQTRLPPPPTELEKQLEEFSEDMNESMEENIQTMEEMLDEGAKLLDEALEQGSQEMSNSFGQAMQRMQEAMRDSIEKMKERRRELEQDTQPTNPDTGEGPI